MYAMQIEELGGPEVFTQVEIEPGAPGRGEVRIRHTAIGLNFIDTYHRSGVYSLPSLPHVLGVEAAGVIEAVGPDVDLEMGTRVAYLSGPGAYAEARVMDASRLVPLPDDISDEVAAAGLVKGMTVEYLVRRTFPISQEDRVLLHAAAGGVGSIATQWLAHLGATVIATVGTDAKADRVRALGADHVIVYTREDFVERTMEITQGRGVDVVYDSVGKATFRRGLEVLRTRGMLVGFGNASGTPDPIDPLELARNGSLFMTRPTLFDYTRSRDELLASAAAFFDVVRSGAVEVDIAQRWPLREVAQAHRALEARQTTGSTILTP